MSKLLSTNDGICNLSRLYQQSDEHDREEGKEAYFRYNTVLHRFAATYNTPFERTVEAFVALSPNNDYHGNLRSLASVLMAYQTNAGENFTVSTYRACAFRALTYLEGSVNFFETVKGPKIRAFCHNILYPHRSLEVTVDGHMVAAWQGNPTMTMTQANGIMGRGKYYQRIAEGITELATSYNLSPMQMQATLWLTRKRLLSIKLSAQYDLFYGKEDLAQTNCFPKDFPPYPTPEEKNACQKPSAQPVSTSCPTASEKTSEIFPSFKHQLPTSD